jgi:hypothetical protein
MIFGSHTQRKFTCVIHRLNCRSYSLWLPLSESLKNLQASKRKPAFLKSCVIRFGMKTSGGKPGGGVEPTLLRLESAGRAGCSGGTSCHDSQIL